MPLISVETLARRLGQPDLVVVDCRWALNAPDHGRTAYRAGHIPGAVFADLETDLSGTVGPGRHPLPDPASFDTTLGSWGVTSDSTVIAYDDAGGAVAARLWWMLTDQGHTDTYVLDGGIDAWIEAGHALDSEDPAYSIGRSAGVAIHPWSAVVSLNDVANRSSGTVVIDARAPERYRGDEEPVDAKPGHIPGAINLPYTANLVAGHFRAAQELRDRFTGPEMQAAEDVVVHCGSGVNACHNILAMELAGLRRPHLYVGSWSEWSSTAQPVATGDQPG